MRAESNLKIPLFLNPVYAGFPSSAEDFIDKRIDLNKELIKHPAATFLVRVRGSSMLRAGISDGDLLVVDRAVEAYDKSIILAVIDGDFTVKRIRKRGKNLYLMPENSRFREIKVTEEMEFEIWGVVRHVIKSYKDN